jgi:hypothetical protein
LCASEDERQRNLIGQIQHAYRADTDQYTLGRDKHTSVLALILLGEGQMLFEISWVRATVMVVGDLTILLVFCTGVQ